MIYRRPAGSWYQREYVVPADAQTYDIDGFIDSDRDWEIEFSAWILGGAVQNGTVLLGGVAATGEFCMQNSAGITAQNLNGWISRVGVVSHVFGRAFLRGNQGLHRMTMIHGITPQGGDQRLGCSYQTDTTTRYTRLRFDGGGAGAIKAGSVILVRRFAGPVNIG